MIGTARHDLVVLRIASQAVLHAQANRAAGAIASESTTRYKDTRVAKCRPFCLVLNSDSSLFKLYVSHTLIDLVGFELD
jgi:hypothetical protein